MNKITLKEFLKPFYYMHTYTENTMCHVVVADQWQNVIMPQTIGDIALLLDCEVLTVDQIEIETLTEDGMKYIKLAVIVENFDDIMTEIEIGEGLNVFDWFFEYDENYKLNSKYSE